MKQGVAKCRRDVVIAQDMFGGCLFCTATSRGRETAGRATDTAESPNAGHPSTLTSPPRDRPSKQFRLGLSAAVSARTALLELAVLGRIGAVGIQPLASIGQVLALRRSCCCRCSSLAPERETERERERERESFCWLAGPLPHWRRCWLPTNGILGLPRRLVQATVLQRECASIMPAVRIFPPFLSALADRLSVQTDGH